MRRQEVEDSVRDAVQSLPGFDCQERAWIENKALTSLADSPADPAESSIPVVVQRWAGVLIDREEPVVEEQLDAAIDAALRMHGGLSQEVALLCRHLVHKWESGGNPQLHTVGDIADFILFALIVLQDETTDLSLLHDIAECRAKRVRQALSRDGFPELTSEECGWLHREIFADFATMEFSPFEEDCAGWVWHVASLVQRVQARRENVPF